MSTQSPEHNSHTANVYKDSSATSMNLNYQSSTAANYITASVNNAMPLVWNPNPNNASALTNPLVISSNPSNFLQNASTNYPLIVNGAINISNTGPNDLDILPLDWNSNNPNSTAVINMGDPSHNITSTYGTGITINDPQNINLNAPNIRAQGNIFASSIASNSTNACVRFRPVGESSYNSATLPVSSIPRPIVNIAPGYNNTNWTPGSRITLELADGFGFISRNYPPSGGGDSLPDGITIYDVNGVRLLGVGRGVHTDRNTLDDGSGNMKISGKIMTPTLYNDGLTLPSKSGTIALLSDIPVKASRFNESGSLGSTLYQLGPSKDGTNKCSFMKLYSDIANSANVSQEEGSTLIFANAAHSYRIEYEVLVSGNVGNVSASSTFLNIGLLPTDVSTYDGNVNLDCPGSVFLIGQITFTTTTGNDKACSYQLRLNNMSDGNVSGKLKLSQTA